MNPQTIKLGIVGNQAVGKTTLIMRAAENQFFEFTHPGVLLDFRTIREYKVKDNLIVNLNIYDVAGLARNSDLAISFIKDASALVLAFNLPDLEYYQNRSDECVQDLRNQINEWSQKIYDNSKANIPVLIVGCQMDKINDIKILDAANDLIQDILKGSIKLNIIPNETDNKIYFPTSSKTGYGVEHLIKQWVLEACKTQIVHGSKLSTETSLKKQKQNDQCC